MKSTSSNIEEYKIKFNNDNTLISEQGENLTKGLKPQLEKLNLKGNTLIICDSYLFHSYGNKKYVEEIKQILISLKVKKIIWVSESEAKDLDMERDLKKALTNQGSSYEQKKIKEHERYWICLEEKRGITVGSSANGFESGDPYILELPKEDLMKKLTKWGF